MPAQSKYKKCLAEAQSPEWGPWTTASFASREARDHFLVAVVDAMEAAWGAEASRDDACSATVRWRSGRFLRLNDMAYLHGGRILVVATARNRR